MIDTGPRPVEPVAVRRTRAGREVWVDGTWLPATDPRAVAARERPIASHPPGPITRRQGTPDPEALHHAPGIPGIDLSRYRGKPPKEAPMATEPTERACVICGTAFTPKRAQGRPQVTCLAPDCLKANRRRTQHARRAREAEERRVERTCEHCGKPFLPAATHVRACSPECAEERHRTNNRERKRQQLGIDPADYRVTDARAKAAAFTAERAAATGVAIEDHQEPDDPPASHVEVTSDTYVSEPAPESHVEAPAASELGAVPRSDEGAESVEELDPASDRQVGHQDETERIHDQAFDEGYQAGLASEHGLRHALESARAAALTDLARLSAALDRAHVVVEYLDGKIADLS